MKVKFFVLGTGSVDSVPRWGCECNICRKAKSNVTLKRRACSGLLTVENNGIVKNILLDAGLQNIEEHFDRDSIDAIVITHFHPDHIQGLLPIRWAGGKNIPVYCVNDTNGFGDLYKNNGILNFIKLDTPFKPFLISGIEFIPVPLSHSKPTFGYLIKYNGAVLSYLCDTGKLPDNTLRYLKGFKKINCCIIDCSFPPGHTNKNHCNVVEALDIYYVLEPDIMCFSHISHDLDLWLENENSVPTEILIPKDYQLIYEF